MNLSESFTFDPTDEDSFATLAYGLDGLVAQMELVNHQLQDPFCGDKAKNEKILSDAMFSVLETLKIYTDIAHGVCGLIDKAKLSNADLVELGIKRREEFLREHGIEPGDTDG